MNSRQTLEQALRLHGTGRLAEAEKLYRSVLADSPDDADALHYLGTLARQLQRFDEAIELMQRGLDVRPDFVQGYYDLGQVFQDLGKKDDALEMYRRAVDIDRACAPAWHAISTVSNDGFSDAEVEELLELKQADTTSGEYRMRLAFALGRHFEIAGTHDRAAEQYVSANSLVRAAFNYDVENDVRSCDALRERFDESFFSRWKNAGVDDDKPIFIVGMPRSGTTLIEQVIASHPRVYGAGELPVLTNEIVRKFSVPDGEEFAGNIENASNADFQSVARRYLDSLPETDADFVTDKMPANFLNIGMIRVLFPNAKIVHCRRDPRDTCLSIFKNLFGAQGILYAYDLGELGRYYNSYVKLMAHWQRVLPDAVYTVDYEAMIEEQEATTRALLDYCGLEWDPACLDFHKLERPVATLSATQVRSPVHSGSVAAWKNYEQMLQPLLDTLKL